MAKTKRNCMLIEEARKKIQTTQLINRLQNHGLGTVDLSPTQVNAIKILLDKTIPNLSSLEHGATDDLKEAIRSININFVG